MRYQLPYKDSFENVSVSVSLYCISSLCIFLNVQIPSCGSAQPPPPPPSPPLYLYVSRESNGKQKILSAIQNGMRSISILTITDSVQIAITNSWRSRNNSIWFTLDEDKFNRSISLKNVNVSLQQKKITFPSELLAVRRF